MLFAGPDGLREIRRLRIGPAHNPDERDRLWDVQAAHILANLPWPSPCTRVVVREVGGVDGSSIVHLDLTPAEAAAAFEADLRPALLSITRSHDARPGNSCVECALVRQCEALVPANGALAQTARGPRRRSLSATDLARYDDCPAAWYYSRELNLPKSPAGSQALLRGSAVHEWLSAAHARGVPCAVEDLPADSGAQDWLSPEAYEAAYPHLVHHVPLCPLAVGPVTVVASERTFHLFDPASDVVVVIKPDMLLRRGRTLILREVKSSESVLITATRSEISSRFVQVHVGLAVIDALAAHHACDSGALELELLTPVGGRLWSWSSAHPMELGVARADIARRVAVWQADDRWEPKPNPLCVTCEVREWCSERDTFANNPPSGLARSGPGPAVPGGATGMSWHPGEPF